jgi:hypothetical protein
MVHIRPLALFCQMGRMDRENSDGAVVASSLFALPFATAIAYRKATDAEVTNWNTFTEVVSTIVAVMVAGMVIPRLLLQSLYLGVFASPTPTLRG